MEKIHEIDDLINYLNVIKKHGKHILCDITITPGVFDIVSLDIGIHGINIEEFTQTHQEFFKGLK